MTENSFFISFDNEGILGSEYNVYNDLIKNCISININSMQETLDIHYSVFQIIFEHYVFMEYIKKELIIILDSVKLDLKNKIMKNYPQDYYLNSKLKIENCGYIKKCYVNGYIDYCNLHKYEHDIDDHEFVYKTPTSAMQEYNELIKYFIYQELVTKICLKIKFFVEEVIKSQYIKVEIVPTPNICSWFKEHSLCFKTREKDKNNKIKCFIDHKNKELFNNYLKNIP